MDFDGRAFALNPRPEFARLTHPDIETLVIGGIFNAVDPNAAFASVRNLLRDAAFTGEKAKRIYVAYDAIVASGKQISLGSLIVELREHKFFEGTAIATATEVQQSARITNLEEMAQKLADAERSRRLAVDLAGVLMRLQDGEPLDEITECTRQCLTIVQPRAVVDIESLVSVHSLNAAGINFVVDGLFAEGAVHAITGDSGAGKTTFLTAMAASIAMDERFLGRKVTPRKVLMLDRENLSLWCKSDSRGWEFRMVASCEYGCWQSAEVQIRTRQRS